MEKQNSSLEDIYVLTGFCSGEIIQLRKAFLVIKIS